MMLVAATPFSSLLEIFVVVPLSIVIGIYGGEGAMALRRRYWGSKRP